MKNIAIFLVAIIVTGCAVEVRDWSKFKSPGGAGGATSEDAGAGGSQK